MWYIKRLKEKHLFSSVLISLSLNIHDALIHYLDSWFFNTPYVVGTVVDTIYTVMSKTDCCCKALSTAVFK